MQMKNCVVRTYRQGYTRTNENLKELLNIGWNVKFTTPFIVNGNTEYIEYILERDH